MTLSGTLSRAVRSRTGAYHPVLPQRSQDRESVPLRQHDVEHDEIVGRAPEGQVQGRRPVRRDVHRIAFLLQPLADEARDLPLVLDDQDPHGLQMAGHARRTRSPRSIVRTRPHRVVRGRRSPYAYPAPIRLAGTEPNDALLETRGAQTARGYPRVHAHTYAATEDTMAGFAEYEAYDALGLADLVRRRQVTPTELLDAAIARVEARNPTINAVVLPLYDYARKAIADGLPDGPFRACRIS